MSLRYLAGYERTVAGGGFPYHAPQPDASTSLLIRSESADARIAWLTEPVPPDERGEFVRFLMLAAIDVNADDPRRWTVRVGDRDAFTIASPLEPVARELRWDGPGGASLVLDHAEVDKYDDLMGCLVMTVPRGWTRPGEPLRVEVRGEGAASRTWFMVYEYPARDRVAVVPVQAVRRSPDGPRRILRVEVVRYADAPARAEVVVGARRFALDLRFGYNVQYVDVPEIARPTALPVSVVVDGPPGAAGPEPMHQGTVTLNPVTRRTVHLLAHSHVDIGYTHEQREVERMQWAHLARALELARRTRDYPPEARFRWNTEVAWAVDSCLRDAPAAAGDALRSGIRSGWIEMDALWANELTSLCSPAELLELTEAARRIARECGVKPLAAMITDIPGFTWSLVTTLARSGVRYLSVGPNRGHRTGRMTARLGDRPFWWVSPSGEERVLCWVHGEGYSLFHTRMYAESIENRLDEATVLPVLERLADASYPHQTVVLRYTVGSDNGPPHEAMPDVVRDWNERYVTPRLVISTVSEAFGALEAEAGSRLPEMRGDLTAYWEDGAASTALETAMNRASAERLAQAEAACLIVRADACAAADLSEEFRSGWRKVLLFDEHTWGSWNSISEPDAELTREQWAVKRSYALSADATSRRLLSLALAPRVTGPSDASAVEVVNTECRPRTDLVRLSRESAPACANARLIDEAGNEVPSQVLSTGELAFVARDVPPLGSRVYRFAPNGDAAAEARARAVPSPFSVSEDGIESGEFAVAVDLGDGSVRSAVWKRGGAELVDGSAAHGLNGYLYVAGRDPASAVPAGRASVVMGESGPVVASLLVSGPAAGCERLTREVVLVAGLDRIELVNTLDKTGVRTPEAVHFAFPMNVPDGTVRYDLAFGACRAETDQLPGGNRNHLTVAYAADVSNGEFGVTLACPDAPLIEVGALRADPIVVGWLDRLEPSSLLFGYAMSNYWETNYRAEQPGRVSVRYVVGPHGRPSGAAMRRFGVAARRPLLAVPTSAGQAPLAGLPCPGGDGVEVVAMRPMNGSVLMTLHNAGRDRVAVEWLRPPGRVRLCDLDGLDPVELRGTLVLPPFAVRSVLVDRRADPA